MNVLSIPFFSMSSFNVPFLHKLTEKCACTSKKLNVQVNPFVPNAPSLYPMETSENLTVF